MNGIGPMRSEVHDDVPIIDLKKPRLRTALPKLRAAVRRIAPDRVVSSMAYLNFGVLASLSTLPHSPSTLVREANSPQATAKALHVPFLAGLLYRALYPRASRIICPSETVADELAGYVGPGKKNIAVLANPVDVVRFREAATRLERHPGAGKRFVCAGRLTHQKGFDRLLNIFAKSGKDDQLTILGTGPEEERLRQLAGSLKIADRVNFVGFVSNPWPLYAGADAFLLASRWEGLPNVALEALACGTPVISTPEAGGILEIAGNVSGNALRVAHSDEEYLRLLLDTNQRAQTRPGPNLLPKSYELQSIVDRFAKILSEGSTFQGC